MSNIPTLRMRNQKRKNNNPLLKLRKHKLFQDSSTIKIDNTNRNFLQNSFATISKDVSITHLVKLNL
jgi:hypothetical protein